MEAGTLPKNNADISVGVDYDIDGGGKSIFYRYFIIRKFLI